MTPDELREARQRLGLTQDQLGRALGYEGPNVRKHVYKLEAGHRPIRKAHEYLVRAMVDGWRPPNWPA